MLSSALSKQGAPAEGKSVGEVFEYSVEQKIRIGQKSVRLVPIFDVERVTLWTTSDNNSDDSDGEKPACALRALWRANSIGLTLEHPRRRQVVRRDGN